MLPEQVVDEPGASSGVECTKCSPSRLQRTSDSADILREQRVGGAVGDDRAAGEDQDPVGQLLGLVQVVGGQQDRGVLQVGQAVHEVVELAPGVRVEPGGRLVEEQHLRPPDDADGHVEPAPLAAGELGDLLARRARSSPTVSISSSAS